MDWLKLRSDRLFRTGSFRLEIPEILYLKKCPFLTVCPYSTIEVAQFDIQKIRNPEIEGEEYQEGPQLGFWNVREYVLAKDRHTCQWCKGKSKDKILNVHHIESRKTGGNSPDNLITLCQTCHDLIQRQCQFQKIDARSERFGLISRKEERRFLP